MDIYTIIIIVLAAIAVVGLLSFGLIIKYLDRRFEQKTKIPVSQTPVNAENEQVPPDQQQGQ